MTITTTTETRDRLWAGLPQGDVPRSTSFPHPAVRGRTGLTTGKAVEAAEDLQRIWGEETEIPAGTTIEQLESGQLSRTGGLETAWTAHQRTRAVPLACPSWCEQDHTMRSLDPDGLLVLPFERVHHELKLGAGLGPESWCRPCSTPSQNIRPAHTSRTSTRTASRTKSRWPTFRHKLDALMDASRAFDRLRASGAIR